MARTSSVVSSGRGKRWLYLFLGGVVLLLVGLASLVWPRVVVHVTPRYEVAQVVVPLKVDLDVTEPVISSLVVPGKLVTSGSTLLGEAVYTINVPRDQQVAVRQGAVQDIVDHALVQVVGEGQLERPGARGLTWGKVVVGRSGRLFTVQLTVHTQVYRDFPFGDWQKHLAGLPMADAQGWLKDELGVGEVTIQVYPSFLANVSKKMPNNPQAIAFTLDTK